MPRFSEAEWMRFLEALEKINEDAEQTRQGAQRRR